MLGCFAMNLVAYLSQCRSFSGIHVTQRHLEVLDVGTNRAKFTHWTGKTTARPFFLTYPKSSKWPSTSGRYPHQLIERWMSIKQKGGMLFILQNEVGWEATMGNAMSQEISKLRVEAPVGSCVGPKVCVSVGSYRWLTLTSPWIIQGMNLGSESMFRV